MAFCSKCGSSISEGAAFCPSCGSPSGPMMAGGPTVAPAGGPVVTPMAVPASGLAENVAGLLCYLLGWLTGIIFLLIDKRPFVRFHAAQSIVVFGGLMILRILLTASWFGYHSFGVFTIWSMLSLLVSLATLVLWVVLMVTAFQGKRLEIPVAAEFAKKIAGSTTF